MISKSISESKIQGVGGVVEFVNQQRIDLYYQKIDAINVEKTLNIKNIDKNLLDALAQVERVREFVAEPDKILGSMQTKHGEIAEEVDVAFQNAWDIMHNLSPSATFEGVGRTAPEDYLVLGIPVQSKYINGTSNSLSHVIEHLKKYENIGFGRNDSYYVIPKDQYEIIEDIRDGKKLDLSDRTIRAIEERIGEIEKITGKNFEKVVHSGNVDYAEVQLGKIQSTLDRETGVLKEEASNQTKSVIEDSKGKIKEAQIQSQPTSDEAIKTGVTGAVISGTIQFALEIYSVRKKNGNWQFTVQDWRNIAKHTGISSVEGGVSGYTIYNLTNHYGMSSAQAAGVVSATFGVCRLANDLRNGKISEGEFFDGAQLVCINSACSTLGATMGQMAIPVPILGALIGSIVTNYICKIGEKYLSSREKELIQKTRKEFDRFCEKLDKDLMKFWEEQVRKLEQNLNLLYGIFDDCIDENERYERIIEFAMHNKIDRSRFIRPQSPGATSYFCD